MRLKITTLVLFSLLCVVTSQENSKEDEREEDDKDDAEDDDWQLKEKLLNKITDLSEETSGTLCANSKIYVPVYFPTDKEGDSEYFKDVQEKVDLSANLLKDSRSRTLSRTESEELMRASVCWTLFSTRNIKKVRVVDSRLIHFQTRENASYPFSCIIDKMDISNTKNEPWFHLNSNSWNPKIFQEQPVNNSTLESTGRWTFPYFRCKEKKWLVTYVKPVDKSSMSVNADVDLTNFNINQCEHLEKQDPLQYFANSHKCGQNAMCEFVENFGWKRGGYKCRCSEGFYSSFNSTFNGTQVEVAWDNKRDKNIESYDLLYTCQQCADGCKNCTDGRPCLADYNMPFRIALLTISILCIFLTIIMMAIVYHYKSVKVFKVASPAFLEICLVGCIIMYLEMATIFPVLDQFTCIATKWARHMGFCITFSSLLMKTWRVSLTYRVKSAHKIKLTDKQLLQWMTPILLIMIVYLGAWTISDPPKGDTFEDSYSLKFKQCTYDNWDHALAVGEMFFLLWGVKVCYGVRKAESFFDEAKCISWAVYNITVVNVIMASFHVFFFPDAGPDLKYFFGFVRTQMSTTTTIVLVFGPKLVRVLKGTGDQLDNRCRAKGVTASFSINGIGGSDEPPDPQEENEELKEEIQKLAAQIEFMKIVHMEVNNRHLKPKQGGYFNEKSFLLSSQNTGQSPTVGKNTNAKLNEINKINENNKFNDNYSTSIAVINPTSDVNSERA